MRSWLIVAVLSLAPLARGQDVAPAPITIHSGNITITISVDNRPAAPPAPEPPAPVKPEPAPGAGKADADFAGASRMYIRGIPLGFRQVAGRVGTDIKVFDDLRTELEAAHKRAANGLARRLADRWAGSISGAGAITDPKPIIDSLNEAAAAMEAGLR
jgi:hypothetical protein